MSAVWTFEGELHGAPVRWCSASAPMLGFDPLLLSSGTIRYGLGDTVGVPQRLSVELTIANDRGALDALALGVSEDGVDWEGPSLRELRGRIYRYTGPGHRVALTPPLVVAELGMDVGMITIQLVADEHAILGPSAALSTVEDWRSDTLQLEWCDPFAATVVGVNDHELPGAFAASLRAGNTTIIPWLYGPTAVRLEAVSEDAVWRIAGMVTEEHAAALKSEGTFWNYWNFYAGPGGKPLLSQDRAYPVLLRHGERPGLLLVFATIADKDVDIEHRFDAASASLPPVEIVRRILEDHAASEDPYDIGSAVRADDATRRLTGVVAGTYADAATVEEVLAAIAPICGVEVYLHLDGRLHFATLPTPEEEGTPVAEIEPYDIFPSGTDHIPAAVAQIVAAPPSFGAVAGRISIDWPESRMDAYPIQTSSDHRQISDAEGEVRLEGAWIHPPRASVALSAAAEWYGYPIRLVSIPTHISIMEKVQPGDVIAWRAPTLPGSERRLGMVRYIEILPGDETAMVTVGDLGWAGMIRHGVLDSFEHWIVFEAPIGTSVTLSSSTSTITLSVAAFAPEDVGRRIWVRGAGNSANNRSYRITSLVNPNTVRVEPAPFTSQSWTEAGGRGLLVMRAADHPTDPDVIGGKIAVSDTPVYANDERAYRFAR